MPYQIPGMPMPLDEDENYKKMLTDQLNAPPTPQDPNAGNGQLIASLAGSFNKLGTVGGRTSDMSDVQRYADVLDKSKAARDQTANGQASKRQQILLSLAQLKDKGAQQQNSMQQAMAMNQTKQDFDTKRDAEKFQRDKDLIGLKQSGEKDLALAKLENSPEKAPKPATADERTSALFSARAKDAANLAKAPPGISDTTASTTPDKSCASFPASTTACNAEDFNNSTRGTMSSACTTV